MNNNNRTLPSESAPTGANRFRIRIERPESGPDGIAAFDLAEILCRLQQALYRIAHRSANRRSAGKGIGKKRIQRICRLYFASWDAENATAALAIGGCSRDGACSDIAERSLSILLDGFALLGHKVELPQGFDARVLRSCYSLGKVLEHGIASIVFEWSGNGQSRSVIFDAIVRERIEALLAKRPETAVVEAVGRLEEVNAHGELTGRLWEPDGTRWYCLFKQEHLAVLPAVWLKTVKLLGRAGSEGTRENVMHVDQISLLGETETETSTATFWTPVSLDDLVQQQAVKAVDDLDELSDLWPREEDEDQFLNHLLAVRAARRDVARERTNP